MQSVWFCFLVSKQFEDFFENTQWRKVKQMLPMWLRIISGSIWKRIVEKIQRNVASVILHPIRQAIWGPIWIFKFWQLLEKKSKQIKPACFLRRHMKIHNGEKHMEPVGFCINAGALSDRVEIFHRWIGLEILIPKPMWKSQIRHLEQILAQKR